jgi:ABC-type uncharacterized transport system substrate-binding protein
MNMTRREFIALIGAAALPVTARAQQVGPVRRVGYLYTLTERDPIGQARVATFEKRFQELGWTRGTNVELHYRWAAGRSDLTQAFATELVALQPDVIVSWGAPNLAALAKLTRTIPIVFVFVSDPVGMGLVQSMARPGGNITGFSAFEPSLGGKWLELLKEVVPGLTRAGIVFNPKTAPNAPPFVVVSQNAGSALGVPAVPVHVIDDTGIDREIAKFAREPDGGLILVPDPFTSARPQLMVAAANRHRLPLISSFRFISAAGGLMSYGIDGAEQARQGAGYVDRILRSEKPGDLPNPAAYQVRAGDQPQDR